jgi:hypothetical protein
MTGIFSLPFNPIKKGFILTHNKAKFLMFFSVCADLQ